MKLKKNKILKDFMKKRKIFLHSFDLLREFSLYNPVEEKENLKERDVGGILI